jgi:hypothetical protein
MLASTLVASEPQPMPALVKPDTVTTVASQQLHSSCSGECPEFGHAACVIFDTTQSC